MASIVTVWNMALGRVGVNATIESELERSVNAETCRAHWDQARDYALSDFPWTFARRRVVLAETGTPPSTWAHCYAYPSDCLFAMALVLPGVRVPRWDQRPPFELGSDGEQTLIYTDLEQAELIYTSRVEDPNRYGAMFMDVAGWALAELIAIPLSAKPELVAASQKGYERAKSKAAAKMLAEGQDGPEPECDLLAARR